MDILAQDEDAAAKMYYKELAERSSYLKNPKESEVDMQDIIELYAEKKAREASKEAEVQKDKEYVCKLLKRGISVDKVADLLEMPKARVEALAEKWSISQGMEFTKLHNKFKLYLGWILSGAAFGRLFLLRKALMPIAGTQTDKAARELNE